MMVMLKFRQNLMDLKFSNPLNLENNTFIGEKTGNQLHYSVQWRLRDFRLMGSKIISDPHRLKNISKC